MTNKAANLTIQQKVKQIQALESLETPWEVKRIFGNIGLWGSQIVLRDLSEGDIVDLAEFRQALQWIVEQCGGRVKWQKEKKNEA